MSEIAAFKALQNYKLASEISATQKMKIAIVGKPKSGKSHFAASAPGTVRIYDFDDRIASLEKLPSEIKANIAVTTLRDADQSKPTAFKALEAELAILKYEKSKGNPIPDWLVFDSITYMERIIKNEAWSQGVDYKFIKISTTKTVRLNKSWDSVNAVLGCIDYLITEASALANIIFVFHEKPEKDVTESTADKTVYSDQYTVDPQYLAKTLSLFNDVWRIQIDASQNYVVTCKPTYEFNAATTLLIDKQEQPNLAKIIEKHKANQEKQQRLLAVSNK